MGTEPSRRSRNLFRANFAGNAFIEAREKQTDEQFSRGSYVAALPDNFGNGFSNFFPLLTPDDHDGNVARPNLSQSVQNYLKSHALPPETIFRHIVATLHAPSYRIENAGALRMDWPRVPLPADADTLRASAGLGATLAALLDPEAPAPGVSTGGFASAYARSGFPQNATAKPWRPQT